MSNTNYVVLSNTFSTSTGMIFAVGFIGLFDDLQKAMDAANQELDNIHAPDYCYLLLGRETATVTVDENGIYTDDVEEIEYGISIDIIRADMNHRFNTGDRAM